jgi:hypothetical protein
MTVYLTKGFARFAGKAGLNNSTLLVAAQAVADGRFDADLGGGVFKQRVARAGGGKSGGYRTIILFRIGGHNFFAHGFAKNDKANVSAQELRALRRLADELLGLSEEQLAAATQGRVLMEVVEDGDDEKQAG